MKRRLQFSASLDLLAADGARQRRFSVEAYDGGKLPVASFEQPVVVDLNTSIIPGSIPLLIDHTQSVDSTVGSTDSIISDGKTLILAGVVSGQSPLVQRVLAQHDAGQSWQASIGCLIDTDTLETVPAGTKATVNGQSIAGPCYIARRATLKETSVLPSGAAKQTSVNLAAAAAQSLKGAAMDFQSWSESMSIDEAKLTDSARAALQMAFDEEMNPPDPNAEGVPAAATALINLRGTHSAEHRRIGAIESLCVGHPLIAAAAIDKSWTPAETEIAILKANARMHAPSNIIHASSNSGTTPQHLSAALMVRAGFSSAAERAYGAKVMEQSRHLHARALPDLCAAALQADGRDVPHERGSMLRAALSTGSTPTALGDSANKIVVEAYKQAPAAWRSFAAIKSVPDFKTATGIRPTFGGDLLQIGPGGKVKHGSYSEETYGWAVNTFAKQFQIDRRDIVNDDLAVFADIIPGLARSGARTLNGLVATTLLANTGSFFGTANDTYFDGAATNLQASSLATAVQMLRQMKDGEGNLLDLQPAVLLVPPELEQTALALLNSTEVARVSTGDELPTGNTLKDIAQLAVEPRLSDAGFSSYSTTAWYLFSDAANAAAVVGFLDGRQEPTIEEFGLAHDIDALAVGFRCYFDFGCALADFRAAIKSKGAA